MDASVRARVEAIMCEWCALTRYARPLPPSLTLLPPIRHRPSSVSLHLSMDTDPTAPPVSTIHVSPSFPFSLLAHAQPEHRPCLAASTSNPLPISTSPLHCTVPPARTYIVLADILVSFLPHRRMMMSLWPAGLEGSFHLLQTRPLDVTRGKCSTRRASRTKIGTADDKLQQMTTSRCWTTRLHTQRQRRRTSSARVSPVCAPSMSSPRRCAASVSLLPASAALLPSPPLPSLPFPPEADHLLLCPPPLSGLPPSTRDVLPTRQPPTRSRLGGTPLAHRPSSCCV